MRAEAETLIDAPVETVFRQLMDAQSWHYWIPGHGGWPDGPPTAIAEGERFRLRFGLVGIYDTVMVTVIESRAPTSLAIVAAGTFGADAHLSFRLEPLGSTTIVRGELQVIGTPTRMVASIAKRGAQRSLSKALHELNEQVITTCSS